MHQKMDAREAIAADLSEKQNEMAFVTSYIANVRKEQQTRDALVAETIRHKKAACLQENAAIADEMRKTQAGFAHLALTHVERLIFGRAFWFACRRPARPHARARARTHTHTHQTNKQINKQTTNKTNKQTNKQAQASKHARMA